MYVLLVTIHVIVCLALILLVLLQAGRGAELGAAFGSVGQANSSRTPMSGIGKVTAVVAASFMVTSMLLAYLSSQKNRESILKKQPAISAEATPSNPLTTTETATAASTEQVVVPTAVPVPESNTPEATMPSVTPASSEPVPQQP